MDKKNDKINKKQYTQYNFFTHRWIQGAVLLTETT